MKKISVLSLLLAVLLLVGCSGSTSSELIGEWEQTVEMNGVVSRAYYDFKSNGKLEQKLVIESLIMNVEAEGECDYSYKGDEIRFKFSMDNFGFNKFEMEGVDESIIDASMEQMKRQYTGLEQELKNVKIEGDKLTATFNGMPITLTKVK